MDGSEGSAHVPGKENMEFLEQPELGREGSKPSSIAWSFHASGSANQALFFDHM